MKVAIIGYGNRGSVYAKNFTNNGVEVVAVCDKLSFRLEEAKKFLSLSDKQLYLSDEEFFARGKMADLLVVSTQDRDHYGHAMRALDIGYDLLLEKPIAESYEKCVDIYNKANANGRKVFVCHVLRYAPFFEEIKRRLDSGRYGKVSTINLTENVAYWHQAHSFVRGNWSVVEKATPMIIAKCCHDLDMLAWLIGKDCKAVSSFGGLDFYTAKNAPSGAATHCYKCKYRGVCPYDAINFYVCDRHGRGWLPNTNQYFGSMDDTEAMIDCLSDENNPYARCVFACDNTAVDHQIVNMQFADGITASLTMTAFCGPSYREIHVHGDRGDIRGDMKENKLYCTVFGEKEEVVDIAFLSDGTYGHGGGDARLVSGVIDSYENGSAPKTPIAASLISHKIGYAAEESRINGGKLVELK